MEVVEPWWWPNNDVIIWNIYEYDCVDSVMKRYGLSILLREIIRVTKEKIVKNKEIMSKTDLNYEITIESSINTVLNMNKCIYFGYICDKVSPILLVRDKDFGGLLKVLSGVV